MSSNGKKTAVILRLLAMRDLERSRRWVNDRTLWPLVLRNSIVSRKDQTRWYQGIRASAQKKVFAIVTREEKRHIGNTGFYEICRKHHRAKFWIFIGDKSKWGMGCGAQATAKMIRYGFGKLRLEKIFLEVASSNLRAQKLYQRFGFVREGKLKKHYRIGRKWLDVEVMSLFRRKHR